MVNIPSQQWGELSGVQSPNTIRQFDGVNKLNSFAIKDGQATEIENFTSKTYPALSVRDGFTLKGAKPANAKVTGLGVHKGSTLHAIANGAWFYFNKATSTWESRKTGLSTTELWSFVNFRGNFSDINLIASNGVNPVLKWDGATVSNLANAPTNLKFICTHDNRLYGAVQDIVKYSALRKAEDWSTAGEAGEIVVETSDGKHITGLVAGPGKLVIFKENSIHELFGTSPSNFQMKPVTEQLGSPAGHSAQMVNGVLFFLGNDAIYSYEGGSLPSSAFSLPVQAYIDGINKQWIHRSVSGTDGRRYYLSIPYGEFATEPNLTLEFDPYFNTWNVFKFTQGISGGFVRLENELYAGDISGQVMKMDGTTDNGTAIKSKWVSKPFSLGSLAAHSRWYRMWIVADIPTGSSLNVYLSDKAEGDTSWSLVKTIAADTNIQAQAILIPTEVVNHSKWIRVKLEGSGPMDIYEVTHQARMFRFGQ